MTHTTDQDLYEQWREDYALMYEPNHDEHLDADCKAAFLAGMQASRRAQVVYKCSECEDTGVGVSHGYDCTACYGVASFAHEPIETVRYWRDVYANPRGDAHFMGHGMVVKILDDYLSLLAAAPQSTEAGIDAQELEHTRREAESLAWNIFNRHFASDEHYASGRVKFGLCDTLRGVLSQIDNMVAGLIRAPVASPVQMPEPYDYVSWYQKGYDEQKRTALYTEHQVRQLLAQHGIK